MSRIILILMTAVIVFVINTAFIHGARWWIKSLIMEQVRSECLKLAAGLE